MGGFDWDFVRAPHLDMLKIDGDMKPQFSVGELIVNNKKVIKTGHEIITAT